MGNKALCRVEYGGEAAEAKVLLETDDLIVRGGMKLRIPFREMEQVAAGDGALTFRWKGVDARIPIGAQAAKWADKIRNPRSVIDKIGVKSGQRVSIVGDLDGELAAVIASRSGDVSHTARSGSDVIFFAVSKREQLSRLETLRRSLAPAGALWVIRPKGTGAISDGDVIAAGRKAGLST